MWTESGRKKTKRAVLSVLIMRLSRDSVTVSVSSHIQIPQDSSADTKKYSMGCSKAEQAEFSYGECNFNE